MLLEIQQTFFLFVPTVYVGLLATMKQENSYFPVFPNHTHTPHPTPIRHLFAQRNPKFEAALSWLLWDRAATRYR